MAGYYGLNTFEASTPIGQGLQNIAMAMFGRGAAQRAGSSTVDDEARARYYDEQARDLSEKRTLAQAMLDSARQGRDQASANFIAAKSGIDPTQSAAIAFNAKNGDLLPDLPIMYSQGENMRKNAALSAIASVMMDDPTKATASVGNADNIEKAYATALDSAVRGGVLDGVIDPARVAAYQAAAGKDVYHLDGSTGQVLNKFDGTVGGQNTPIYQSVVKKNAATTARDNASAAQYSTGAMLNKAKVDLTGAQTANVNAKTGEVGKPKPGKGEKLVPIIDQDGTQIYVRESDAVGKKVPPKGRSSNSRVSEALKPVTTKGDVPVTKQQYDALPPGARYLHPDGTYKIKGGA